MAKAMVDLFQSFSQPGKQLIDAGDLNQLVQLLFSSSNTIVAAAGGTQALATPLTVTWNELATVVTNSDSVMLPLALPGRFVGVNNDTGQTLAVFGQIQNPENANAGDTIAAAGSTVQQATATGVTQLTGVATIYVCTTIGQWKQFAIT